jgi:hypothetical protein
LGSRWEGREGWERGEMAGVEELDKGRHNNEGDIIMMTMLPLPLPPPDDL